MAQSLSTNYSARLTRQKTPRHAKALNRMVDLQRLALGILIILAIDYFSFNFLTQECKFWCNYNMQPIILHKQFNKNKHNDSIIILNQHSYSTSTSCLLRESAVNKRYSLLRGTATAIDLHQLGKPEVHDIYAPMKVVYGHLSQCTVYNSNGSSLTEWAAVSPSARRGRSIHSDAAGLKTNVPVTIRCRNHPCYISLLVPIY